jgi:hypothetical protein
MRRDKGPFWRPAVAGVALKPLANGPAPAESPKPRLNQLRDLARRFEIEDDFHPIYSDPATETHTLRLLTTPLHRYGGTVELVDGALFGLVITTDPEALVMIELHKSADGPKWLYAPAPMTVYSLRAKLDGELVWDRPEKRDWKPDEPYKVGLFR